MWKICLGDIMSITKKNWKPNDLIKLHQQIVDTCILGLYNSDIRDERQLFKIIEIKSDTTLMKHIMKNKPFKMMNFSLAYMILKVNENPKKDMLKLIEENKKWVMLMKDLEDQIIEERRKYEKVIRG